MRYKITEHYARGEEKLIAEFHELNEARFFIAKKPLLMRKQEKIIYRLYDDNELLHELNKASISITHASYAEGNSDFNNAAPLIFQVMVKTMNSLEKEIIAQFHDKHDAKLFIECKIEVDQTIHDGDLFFIFKNKILIDTANKIIIANRKKEAARSAGNEKSRTLSPLPTRPTPSGGPPDYWVDKRDDDEHGK
ncbi:hypothetical protein [Legionella tunisiensis]|uniref:hypothetical protein n=1 Tax=Legionella tunisiensis TaxID=1034944 RepID=UPI0002E845F2|nr:hypothetical protein [Legionella tunisiensis]